MITMAESPPCEAHCFHFLRNARRLEFHGKFSPDGNDGTVYICCHCGRYEGRGSSKEIPVSAITFDPQETA
jgi:hypothetical protein